MTKRPYDCDEVFRTPAAPPGPRVSRGSGGARVPLDPPRQQGGEPFVLAVQPADQALRRPPALRLRAIPTQQPRAVHVVEGRHAVASRALAFAAAHRGWYVRGRHLLLLAPALTCSGAEGH